jgi:hypothetical protein
LNFYIFCLLFILSIQNISKQYTTHPVFALTIWNVDIKSIKKRDVDNRDCLLLKYIYKFYHILNNDLTKKKKKWFIYSILKRHNVDK